MTEIVTLGKNEARKRVKWMDEILSNEMTKSQTNLAIGKKIKRTMFR